MVSPTRSKLEAGGAELAAAACPAAVETGGKGAVPLNLCEAEMEGIRADLERAKWWWLSEADRGAARGARATAMAAGGAKSAKLNDYLGWFCKQLAQGRY